MKKSLYFIIAGCFALFFTTCDEDDKDLSTTLQGYWKQEQVYIDDVSQDLSAGELNTSLLIEANGVYRLFDGVENKLHHGTWLFSDGDWMNLTMDKIQNKNTDGSYTFGQVLVRFTILKADASTLDLRIKTYLFERKETVMFNLIGLDDTTGMTGEQKMALDTKNKEQHTYRYVFKKANL